MKISFEQKYQDSSAMTDAEFIQAIEWTGKANSSLKEIFKSESDEEKLAKLAGSLRKSFPKPDSKILRRKKYAPLFEIPVTLWSAKTFPETESTLALVLIRKGWEISSDKSQSKSGKKKSKKNKPESQNLNSPCEELEEWLDQSYKASSSNPYELILLLDILFLFSKKMKESLFWKLWRTTLAATQKYLDQAVQPRSRECLTRSTRNRLRGNRIFGRASLSRNQWGRQSRQIRSKIPGTGTR